MSEEDFIPAKFGNEMCKKKHESMERKIKEAREKNTKVQIQVPKSLWERWETPKCLIKAYTHSPYVLDKIKFLGEQPLFDFRKNLEDQGFEPDKIEDVLNLLFKISSAETAGIQEIYKTTNPSIIGFPTNILEKELQIDKKREILDVLLQFETIKEYPCDHLNNNRYSTSNTYKTSEKGKKIIDEYSTELISNKEIEDLFNDTQLSTRLLYGYLHPETLKFNPERITEYRPFEIGRFEQTSLIGSILSLDGLTIGEPKKWIESKNDIVMMTSYFWDRVEDRDFAFPLPILETTKSEDIPLEHKQGTKGPTEVLIGKSDIYQRVSNPTLLKNLVDCYLENEEDQKIIRAFMLINNVKKKPKKLKSNIRYGRNNYGFTKDDYGFLGNVINSLSEKDITSKWSDVGDIPYTMKDYDAFLEFSREYLLGFEDLDLEEV